MLDAQVISTSKPQINITLYDFNGWVDLIDLLFGADLRIIIHYYHFHLLQIAMLLKGFEQFHCSLGLVEVYSNKRNGIRRVIHF